MNRERVIVAVVAFSLVLAVVFLDWQVGTHLGSFVLVLSLGVLAQAEIYPLFRRMGLESNAAFGVSVAFLLFLFRGVTGWLGQKGFDLPPDLLFLTTMFLFSLAVVAPFVKMIVRGPPGRPATREEFERPAVTLLGLLLVWFLLSFLLELRMLDSGDGTTRLGLQLTLILVLSVKLGDSAAYLVGRSIGATPLSWVSPKKTWEGAAGSIAGSVATAVALGLFFGFVWWEMLLFGVVTSIAGQIGDLLESLIKRRSGVKDSGTFLREIGGFLDLLDSLLLAAPVGYLYVRIVVL